MFQIINRPQEGEGANYAEKEWKASDHDSLGAPGALPKGQKTEKMAKSETLAEVLRL
jgi:hypothetical protein